MIWARSSSESRSIAVLISSTVLILRHYALKTKSWQRGFSIAIGAGSVEACLQKPAGFLNRNISMKDAIAYWPTKLGEYSLLILHAALVLALFPQRGVAQVISGSERMSGRV